uniref:E3 ubiquitin-protein ligase SH3RF1 n=1 Tax=Scatophagus argus TaxID=75038 RepID=UPI001ED7D7E4|nr:E3 ubiquitin-protein ligase SH3RF1 [Scatophagus argus]XP_046261935.1 E3 ubiquitin-protein ligase SH3RF1 [Scatophagus argus]XP_046261937.1 E3 ubiquitin-protein ligase SH3RF1 [Scatophagus argus]
MVDYSVSGVTEDLLSERAGPFKMEKLSLMALLECPLCFEQLDGSAKVLPCQHTFCMSCLQRQETAHSQLFCPECHTPVPARTVEELPANILLMRLLEGLQGSVGPSSSRQTARYSVPLARGSITFREGQQQQQQWESQPRERKKQGHYELALRAPMHYQQGESSGELVLTPANSIALKPKVNVDGLRGNASDSSGVAAAANTLQAVSQVPQVQPLQHSQPPALCRALYNFIPEEMNLEDSRCCLSFLKGDILTVIRRVDEDWIEAKLGEKVGVCPLQFTEPNSVAAKLLEGKNRRGSDSAESHHRTGSGVKDKATDVSNRTTHYGVPQVAAKTPMINALPLSNQRKQSAASSANFYQTTKGETTNISTFNSFNRQGQSHRLSVPPAARGLSHPSRVNSQRIKRHSDTTHRQLLQSEKKMTSETPPTISMALVNPQMSSASADGKNSSTQQLSISVCAVLYSYKPRRPEELELRKGEMVGVYGKFKEGWLRGLSLRTGKVGILPSNYISPVLRTSARLLETKATNASSQYNTVTGKKPTAAKNPAVVLALDRVNADGTIYSTGQVPSVPNGAQHALSSTGAGKLSLYGCTQGWDTVRRIFNPHRGSNRTSNLNIPSNSKHFAQVQASGYSPALQRKKNSSSNSGRPLGWMTEPPAPSAAAVFKDRDFFASHEATFQPDRQPFNRPQSILVKPDSHRNNIDKPAKSVRFLTDEDSPPPRPRTSSWSSINQVPPNCGPGPPSLEVWAPSLTLGRDGPGIILKEGKVPVLRKGLETTTSDLNSNPQKPILLQPSLSAVSAQFSPIRHRVTTTHLAQMDSELSLLQGEVVLVHKPRPDGRILVTQESSGQTGLFHSSVLQALERLS